MFRQCELQQGNSAVRGWIPEQQAKQGAQVEIKGLPGLWDINRIYGYSVTDEGLTEIKKHQRSWAPRK